MGLKQYNVLFCKCAQIMQPTDDACSNFLPSHWTSEKNAVKLVKGAKLEHERLIFTTSMFDQEVQ